MTEEGAPTPQGSAAIQLKVIPNSDFYRADDPRHESEVFELQQALYREFPRELEARPLPEMKGGIELILTVAPGPVIMGLADVLRAWLGSRPVHRSIDVVYEVDESDGKRTGTIHVDASNVDSQQLAMITGEAFKQGRS